MRNRALIAIFCALCCLLWPMPGEERSVQALVEAARTGGMSPHALYVRADIVYEGDAASLIRWAKKVAASLPGGEVAVEQDAQKTRIAIGAVYPPNGAGAKSAERVFKNALGYDARISYCVIGTADGPAHDQAAQALLRALHDTPVEGMRGERLSSLTGEWAQAAVRADGTAYLGMPLIPMAY